ncbi:MAG: hypothetical protein GY942_01360 [Aestuariibacter sp.]|nr:hypothetical protein [Aestuariibacter sp.]
MLTLEEHKAQTAAEEANEIDEVTQTEVEEVEELATEEDEQETEAAAAEEDDGETETEQEAWMQSETEDSQGDDLSSNGNISAAAIRKKYQAQAAEKASIVEDKHKQELDEMRAQLAAAQGQNNTVSQQQAGAPKPKRDDFFEADDPDDAYEEAVFQWRNTQNQARLQQEQMQQGQQKLIQAQELALDEHYSRAAKLGHGITAEAYQQSDHQVKTVLGEVVANQLIASMGEGSEKVFYSLGRNPTKLAELQIALQSDPSGIKAAMLLGKMSNAATPPKRRSSAPAPANTARGDANTGKVEKGIKKAYDKASKSGDGQAAYNARRQAREAGIDVSKW